MELIITEKASVARTIASVLNVTERADGYLRGRDTLISWCIGHLVELALPEAYDPKYVRWRYKDLPILPAQWQYNVSEATKKQFGILKSLMNDERVTGIICATDAGREGELIFQMCIRDRYYPLVNTFHGQVIRISPTSSNYINPMDINLDYSDDDNPLSLKSDFILSLCELIVGGRDGLQPIEKRCV